MSLHTAFRRQPVPQQYASALQTTTLPAPTRGIIQSENEAFMQPGGAIVQDNWIPTLRGVRLRAGTQLYCDLHPGVPRPDPSRLPVISAFEYVSGLTKHQMFAAQQTKLFNVSTSTAVQVASGMNDGNYTAAQLSSQGGDFLLAVNDAGDYPLQYDGTTWLLLNGNQIHANAASVPAGSPLLNGKGLTQVWKYRNRLYFIQGGSMSAWYLPLNAVQGQLELIPLSGAAAKGGSLLFGATWSIDAGDGIDDKCVFCTDQGELLIFTGGNPGDPNNWQQEGRYEIPPPMGKNAHVGLGGDLLIATADGIVPVSQAINKDSGTLELAMLTRTIDPMWHAEAQARGTRPWSLKKWDEQGALLVTLPGGAAGNRRALWANNVTGAWARVTGWDALCFVRMLADCFFGTQDGTIEQCERTGTDDGAPYVATLVSGWEMFQAPSNEVVLHQLRAVFGTTARQLFEPQLDSTVDFVVTIPPPPPPGPDPGPLDVWDTGLWDQAKWDQPATVRPPIQNTLWVSVGKTGFAHAPIVQVTVAQTAVPSVELLAIGAIYERAGVNV